MSRITSPARHRADVAGNIALQGFAHSVKSHATTVGRPAAIVAVTSGLAFGAMGTANASSYTNTATQSTSAAHTVVAGDTLGGISAIHGVDLNSLLAANGLSLASVIYPGQTIAIPAAGAAVAAPAQTVSVPVAAAAAPTQYAASVAAPAQYAASVAAAPAASAAAGSSVYLANSEITPIAKAAPVAQAPVGNVAGILVASAQSQIGSIQDCTILVERALRAAGFTVGDLGPSQFFQFGTVVSTPAPGDIVITSGHVAIYVGGGQVISSGMNGANLTMQHSLSDLPGASFVRVG